MSLTVAWRVTEASEYPILSYTRFEPGTSGTEPLQLEQPVAVHGPYSSYNSSFVIDRILVTAAPGRTTSSSVLISWHTCSSSENQRHQDYPFPLVQQTGMLERVTLDCDAHNMAYRPERRRMSAPKDPCAVYVQHVCCFCYGINTQRLSEVI
jgi:hypothetical protein